MSTWVFSPSAPRLIHQMPCLGFLGTAIVPEILTSVVIDRNGHSSLNHYVTLYVGKGNAFNAFCVVFYGSSEMLTAFY